MASLYLPPHVSREHRDGTSRAREEAFASIDPHDPVALEWTEHLQRNVDSRLMMVRARETVILGVPMKPGYYHVAVDDGRLISFTPVEGADGEFTVPTSRVVEKLHAGNLGERRNLERIKCHERHEHAAVERDKQREREERRDHLGELVKAYTQVSVPGTGQTWTQNQAGRRDAGQRAKGRS